MITCDVCGCPASTERAFCAWCDNALAPLAAAGDSEASEAHEQRAATTFAVERTGDRVEWLTDGTAVASAEPVHGLWQISDARHRHVVTLMPLTNADDPTAVALVGPTARLLGTVKRCADLTGRAFAAARDERGETVLVLRDDSPVVSHVVDRDGEVVAVCSRGTRPGSIDLLVTASGTHQSMAMVFGLVLAAELEREPGRHAG